MTRDVAVPPDPHLMESLRAVGYTLSTAMADLIDNSITAGAASIEIVASSQPDDFIAVIDDGAGMSIEKAQHAMKLAGASPRTTRDPEDLGRFGLGLKTASLSQCRKIALVTKRGNSVVGYEWDLDYIRRTKNWTLLELDEAECSSLPGYSLLSLKTTGTMVLWRDLDLLTAAYGTFETGLNRALSELREHIALVFHRFLAGEHGRDLEISLNGRRIEGADPLLPNHKSTQVGPLESISVDNTTVEIQSFTLPHISKLSSKQRTLAQINGSVRDSQGFYIYRQLRLVIWGTWFRILPKRELGKLARVRVDIPNTLDHLWSLDIKKSQANPPTAIRERLKNLSAQFVSPSHRVASYRGRTVAHGNDMKLWEIREIDNKFQYEINEKHPTVSALIELSDVSSRSMLRSLFKQIAGTFPIDHAYNLLGQDYEYDYGPSSEIDLELEAKFLWEYASKRGADSEQFVLQFSGLDVFSSLPDPESFLRKVAK